MLLVKLGVCEDWCCEDVRCWARPLRVGMVYKAPRRAGRNPHKGPIVRSSESRTPSSHCSPEVFLAIWLPRRSRIPRLASCVRVIMRLETEEIRLLLPSPMNARASDPTGFLF